MNYLETVDYLYTHLPMFQRVGVKALKKDLTNTIRLTEALGNPQAKFRSIHIAGTNGKGSSAHTIAAILQSAGYRTGLYTSPHLKNFTERIRINGREIPEAKVISFVEKIKPQIESIRPSFFEVTVAMAFDYFASEKVDIAVIETGLGGRLDSTNIIQPEVSLITNIGLDHQAILGESLEEIAMEKAGIIKESTPIVVGEYQEQLAPLFEEKAKSLSAPLTFAAKAYRIENVHSEENSTTCDVYFNDSIYLNTLIVSLTGRYQLANIPGILGVVAVLKTKNFRIPDQAVIHGFKEVKSLTGLKGRWQILDKNPLTICDTGHNEAGLSYIVQQLRALSYNKLHMVLGASNDKKLDGILKILPKEAFYYFCQAKLPRALRADELAKQGAQFGLHGTIIADVNEAINEARLNAQANDVIFIGGSSFVVAEIEEL